MDSTKMSTASASPSAATAGSTIHVEPGTYQENLVWPATDGIRLVAEAGPVRTTIDGGGTAMCQLPRRRGARRIADRAT